MRGIVTPKTAAPKGKALGDDTKLWVYPMNMVSASAGYALH
jgi:hypothetical protein